MEISSEDPFLFTSNPLKCNFSPYTAPPNTFDIDHILKTATNDGTNNKNNDLQTNLLKTFILDDKSHLISLSTSLLRFPDGEDDDVTMDHNRAVISKLLHLCCSVNSVNCATSLINGELDGGRAILPSLINEVDISGMSPLHAAAEAHAFRCVEMLLKKRARTDLRTKDGRGLLPLELSLYKTRKDMIWNPDDHTIEELMVELSDKDLRSVRLLIEKTKEFDDVAYRSAVEGRVVDLAVLLVVAAKKINELIIEVQGADLNSKIKTTIFECVIEEALGRGSGGTSAKLKYSDGLVSNKEEEVEAKEGDRKRKLLLFQIELLQLFGVVALTSGTDKKLTSPLILASQVKDEAIIELLLKTNIDIINDVDADGNSALHWCLRTTKGMSMKQIRIMMLLLRNGAKVNQKNKLGLTAVHIAAGNGNMQALKTLLAEDPDTVNCKTETKETPLYFAVKNDHKYCVEALLRWGASTEVFNLRKQRPVDLAQSQDMRFLLNPTNISLTNSSLPIRHRYTVCLQGDEVISETCEELFPMTNEGKITDRTCPSMKTEICKYFESPTGCARGGKCLFAHDKEELRQMKQRTDAIHSYVTGDPERKIFVGGLPPSVDSDLLRKLFDKKFGSVDDAQVVEVPPGDKKPGDKKQSRGFGFVTFKHKKSVSEAVKEHYIAVMGKQIEIKSAIPKCILLAELQKSTRLHEHEHQHEGKNAMGLTLLEKANVGILSRKTHNGDGEIETELPSYNTEEAKSTSIDMILHGQPHEDASKCHMHRENVPRWLKIFKKWLPTHLQQVAKRNIDYALSSLKADFRIAFGLEMDHASLGFSKLSDFIRTFPDICHTKFMPIGKQKSSNHMILLPSLRKPYSQQLHSLKVQSSSCHATEVRSRSEYEDTKDLQDQDIPSVSSKNGASTDCISKQSHQTPNENSRETPAGDYSMFLQFLIPDSTFHSRPWNLGEYDTCIGVSVAREEQAEKFKGPKPTPQERHVVLEALARKRKNPSAFFLREFDFYDNYKASIVQGRCFGCNQRRVLWANIPCQHLLWCGNCKLEVALAARSSEHKCVVCDIKVQNIDVASLHEYYKSTSDKIDLLPAFNPQLLTQVTSYQFS
ncbi:uncharacterized protein LOC126676363 [Mercurialis annua]|uniref:uncharacterized protein LOC126676363 n=1 Tax=Mercurialis annua TaxID=3986 RepID=UPI00215F3567|nr:uncharacterized protein LOC126676363 [Mercurialis annua]